jgi:putative ABC transport system permease protein
MELIEAFKLALQSLWGNKLRSILTLIGVVMGVASVIMVITLVNGANTYVSTKLLSHGADVFEVKQMPGVIFSAEEYFKYNKRKILRIEDYQAIQDGCHECTEVGVRLDKTVSVVAGSNPAPTPTCAAHLDHGRPRQPGHRPGPRLHPGRRLQGHPQRHHRLRHRRQPARRRRPHRQGDPRRRHPFTVVGVGARQGKMLGQSQDNWVAVPITTFQQTYGYNDSVDIYARAAGTPESMEQAKDEVRVIMRARRHNAVGQPDDFEIETNDTFLDIWKQISGIFFDVVIGIASISLVVGGIVIMNIMLVSVTERTREIGVRKALGARQRDVLLQFLIESGTMALIGGFIGVLCGVIVAKLITVIIGFPTSVQLWSVLLGLFMATATGIFFGVYPASKAAKLDPVVALRAEM